MLQQQHCLGVGWIILDIPLGSSRSFLYRVPIYRVYSKLKAVE